MPWPIQNKFKVLLTIYENYRLNAEKYTTSHEIEEKTGMDLKIISNNLKKLLKKGYIIEIKNKGYNPNKYIKNLYKMHPYGIEYVNRFIKEFHLEFLSEEELLQIFRICNLIVEKPTPNKTINKSASDLWKKMFNSDKLPENYLKNYLEYKRRLQNK